MLADMMRFEKQVFQRVYDRDSGRVFRDIEFIRCQFLSSALSIPVQFDPMLRSTVQNIQLVNCEQRGCSLACAIVQDVLVDGFKTNGLFQIWGAAFRHLTIRGKIGRLMISSAVSPGRATDGQQRMYDIANEEFYSSVDWAIDITQAEFEECDLRSRIPVGLIRRDPETQIVITRSRVLDGKWRELDLSKTHWGVSIENLLRDGCEARIFIAPKRSKNFDNLLIGLQMLRSAGIAEDE
jgi:hypothetical protein